MHSYQRPIDPAALRLRFAVTWGELDSKQGNPFQVSCGDAQGACGSAMHNRGKALAADCVSDPLTKSTNAAQGACQPLE